jgi:hypothetical protein
MFKITGTVNALQAKGSPSLRDVITELDGIKAKLRVSFSSLARVVTDGVICNVYLTMNILKYCWFCNVFIKPQSTLANAGEY